MSDYQITDSDIDATLRYLEIFHPEQATRMFAENWLRFWKSKYRTIALDNLDSNKLEELFTAFEKSKGQNI